MDIIYNKYVEYRKQHNLVVIEGLSGREPGLGNVNDLDAKIAVNCRDACAVGAGQPDPARLQLSY